MVGDICSPRAQEALGKDMQRGLPVTSGGCGLAAAGLWSSGAEQPRILCCTPGKGQSAGTSSCNVLAPRTHRLLEVVLVAQWISILTPPSLFFLTHVSCG